MMIEYRDYMMHCRGISCTMSDLQKHMVGHMLYLVKTDPNCRYTAEQGSAISHFIRTFCERRANYEWVLPDDTFNDLRHEQN